MIALASLVLCCCVVSVVCVGVFGERAYAVRFLGCGLDLIPGGLE